MDTSHLSTTEIIRRSVEQGCTDGEALERVRLFDPLSKTTMASIASTRSRMRQDGPQIPTSRNAIALRIAQLAKELVKLE